MVADLGFALNFESTAVKPSRITLRPAVMGGEDREGEDGMGCSVLSVLFCLYIAEWTQAPVWALPEVLWVAVEPPFLLFL